jgi:hypothetical protein
MTRASCKSFMGVTSLLPHKKSIFIVHNHGEVFIIFIHFIFAGCIYLCHHPLLKISIN